MLQNRAIPSPLSAPLPTELAGSLERTLLHERFHTVKRTLSLPDSLQSFFIFLVILVFICAALTAHLLLSTQIHESELRLIELRALNQSIEQETTILIEEIALESSLERGIERVRAMGFELAYERRYVSQAPTTGWNLTTVEQLGSDTADQLEGEIIGSEVIGQ